VAGAFFPAVMTVVVRCRFGQVLGDGFDVNRDKGAAAVEFPDRGLDGRRDIVGGGYIQRPVDQDMDLEGYPGADAPGPEMMGPPHPGDTKDGLEDLTFLLFGEGALKQFAHAPVRDGQGDPDDDGRHHEGGKGVQDASLRP